MASFTTLVMFQLSLNLHLLIHGSSCSQEPKAVCMKATAVASGCQLLKFHRCSLSRGDAAWWLTLPSLQKLRLAGKKGLQWNIP
ncbi:hypothetical protein EI94DRAFT_1721346 [Lactarius quietus]|nr:hypothetical protein EI94DRAFT_1721346 [Lactarius quietus]